MFTASPMKAATSSAGADSVGRQTTVSVVQSIFLVIIVDAILVVNFGSWGLR